MKACRGSAGTRSKDGMILAWSQRCLAGCGGPLAIGGTKELLLYGRDSSTSPHRLKTSGTSNYI